MQVKQQLQQILKSYMASCVPVQLPSEISPTKECRHHFEGFSEIWGCQRFVINMERDGGQIPPSFESQESLGKPQQRASSVNFFEESFRPSDCQIPLSFERKTYGTL